MTSRASGAVTRFTPGPNWELNGLRFVERAKAHGSTETFHSDDFPVYAAAPELYDALKIARECIAYCRRAHKDVQSGDGFPVEIILDAALRKARGETP